MLGCGAQRSLEGPTGKIPDWAISEEGPRAGLMLMDPGICIVHSEGRAARHLVLTGGSPFFVSHVSDGIGLESAYVEVISGGQIVDASGKSSRILRSPLASDGMELENEMLSLEGRLVFDRPGSSILLRAGGRNLAGEEVVTPVMEVVQLDPPEAKLTSSKQRVQPGELVELSFGVKRCYAAQLNGEDLGTSAGRIYVRPERTTRYVLEAVSRVGRVKAEVLIVVEEEHGPGEDVWGEELAAAGNPGLAYAWDGQKDEWKGEVEESSHVYSHVECLRFGTGNGDLVQTERVGPFSEWELDLREGCTRQKIRQVRNLSDVRLNISVGTFSATLGPGESSNAFKGADFGAYYLIVAGSTKSLHWIELEICIE